MGFVLELLDVLKGMSFCKTVNEYEQGLHFRKGKVIERRIKFNPGIKADKDDLERIVASEKDVAKNIVGSDSFCRWLHYHVPFKDYHLPAGYKRSFLSGLPKNDSVDKTVVDKYITDCVGSNDFLFRNYFKLPFKGDVVLPEGYRQDWKGYPLSPKRFDKKLRAGFYFNLPIIDRVVVESKQEKVLDLANINVPLIDDSVPSVVASDASHTKPKVPIVDNSGSSIVLSGNIHYEVMDLYRAYTVVDDYENSLKKHCLSILAMQSRGKKLSDWKNPEVIKSVEKDVVTELRTIVTEKWGVKIHRFYLTDHVPCRVNRVMYEGPPFLARDVIGSDVVE